MPDNSTSRVILARHGRTALNAAGQLRGHLDPPLDDVGQQEVTALGLALAVETPCLIVSSPLLRARQTADAIARATGTPTAVDQRLIDRDYGEWAGHTLEEIVQAAGSLEAARGVEPARSVSARAREVLDEAADLAGEQPVILVAHDAVNTLLLTLLAPRLREDHSFAQHTACWNVLKRSGDTLSVLVVNRTAPAQP